MKLFALSVKIAHNPQAEFFYLWSAGKTACASMEVYLHLYTVYRTVMLCKKDISSFYIVGAQLI